MKPLSQSSSSLDRPDRYIKSQLVKDSLNSSSFGVRSFLAWNLSIGLLFASISAAGLYQPEYVMTFGLQEGNTEQEVFDEEMGGAVAMQLEEFVEEVETTVEEQVEEVQPELVQEAPPEPIEEVEPEPELEEVEPVELIQPLTTEAVFKVETPEPILETLPEEKKIERKRVEKPRPRPQPLATSPRPQRPRSSQSAAAPSTVRSSSVGTSGGTGGSGRGLRLGGRGAKGRFPAPPYPSFARKKNAQGSVTLAITVNDAGTVTGVRVISSTGFTDLDSYACSWIQSRWRWPAGQAKTYRQPVVFRLR